MTDINKLPDEWRETEVGEIDFYESNYPAGQSQALHDCADELQAALPKWTKITDDPDTWPVGDEYMTYNGDNVVHCQVPWESHPLFGYSVLFWWRPLCSLDFPPRVKNSQSDHGTAPDSARGHNAEQAPACSDAGEGGKK